MFPMKTIVALVALAIQADSAVLNLRTSGPVQLTSEAVAADSLQVGASPTPSLATDTLRQELEALKAKKAATEKLIADKKAMFIHKVKERDWVAADHKTEVGLAAAKCTSTTEALEADIRSIFVRSQILSQEMKQLSETHTSLSCAKKQSLDEAICKECDPGGQNPQKPCGSKCISWHDECHYDLGCACDMRAPLLLQEALSTQESNFVSSANSTVTLDDLKANPPPRLLEPHPVQDNFNQIKAGLRESIYLDNKELDEFKASLWRISASQEEFQKNHKVQIETMTDVFNKENKAIDDKMNSIINTIKSLQKYASDVHAKDLASMDKALEETNRVFAAEQEKINGIIRASYVKKQQLEKNLQDAITSGEKTIQKTKDQLALGITAAEEDQRAKEVEFDAEVQRCSYEKQEMADKYSARVEKWEAEKTALENDLSSAAGQLKAVYDAIIAKENELAQAEMAEQGTVQ